MSKALNLLADATEFAFRNVNGGFGLQSRREVMTLASSSKAGLVKRVTDPRRVSYD